MAELVYPPVVRFALGVFRALRLDLAIDGTEHVPADGGAVVAMNHLSYLDFALAGVPFWYAQRRLVRFMAKDAVFTHRVSGPLMRGMHHIPVDRAAGADAYAAAVAALRAGELVGVFPEATISRSFCLKEFKSGAVRMAHEAGVPVIPVVLWGSQRIWTKGRPRDLRGARGARVVLSVGAPLAPTGDTAVDTAALMTVMQRQLDTAQAGYPPPAAAAGDWWVPAHLGGSAPTPEQAAELERAERDRRDAQRRDR